MALNHTLHALMVGMSENWWRAGIMPCVRSDLERDKPVAYIFWLVDGPNGPVVVDTGYHPDYVAPEWAQGKDFIEPPALLKELGVRAEEIQTVVVTHFHQDHFTGLDYFPRAKFIIQRAELEFWTGPLMRHEIFDKQIRPKVRPALKKLQQEGRIQLIDGDFELYPGLDLLKAGGHTPGSQMVALDTAAGKAVLCGDIAYTLSKSVPGRHLVAVDKRGRIVFQFSGCIFQHCCVSGIERHAAPPRSKMFCSRRRAATSQ